MIDIENAVFDAVYPAVSEAVPTGCFKSMFVPNPPQFPFATLMEMDNYTDTARRSTTMDEEYAVVTYEANVYATSKSQCRSVMNILDAEMVRLNFNRVSMQFVPNLADPSLFRLTARYRAEVSYDKVVFRK